MASQWNSPLICTDVWTSIYWIEVSELNMIKTCGINPHIYGSKFLLLSMKSGPDIIALLILLSGDVEQNPGPNNTELIRSLCKYLKDVKDKYFALGVALCVPVPEIKKFQKEGDVDQRFIEVLNYWLCNCDEKDQEIKLFQALIDIDNKVLANNLKRQTIFQSSVTMAEKSSGMTVNASILSSDTVVQTDESDSVDAPDVVTSLESLPDSGSLSATSQTPDKESQKLSGLVDDSLPTLATSDAQAGIYYGAKNEKRDINNLDEIDEPSTSVNVHGAITTISPVKKGRKTVFFDATLADTTSKVRLVGFSPQQQLILSDLHKTSSAVELDNCEIKHSRQGQGYDIILKSSTKIKKSSRKLDMNSIIAVTVDSKLITLDELPNFAQYEKISVNIKVLELQETEEINKKVKRDVIIADHTAASKVVLWEGHVDSLEEGKSYNLKNFHVKEYQLKKHLSMPKTDFEISQIDDTVQPQPSDEITTLHNVQVIGVQQLDSYKCCLQCMARVEPMTPPLGKCTKDDCLMMQLYDLCVDKTSAKMLLRYTNEDGQHEHIICLAFGDIVFQVANIRKSSVLTKSDLLKCRPIAEMKYVTEKKIITLVLRS